MPLKQRSFWADPVEAPAPEPLYALPSRADVAVIGAGFTGLSAARTLAKRGAHVAVLEAETAGWGASSRNGGMVLTGLKLWAGKLLEKYGRGTAREMYAASLRSIDCVEEIVAEEGIVCDFVRSGHLEVASKPSHFEGLRRTAEVLEREFAHPVRIIRKEDLGSEIGSEIYHGALVDEMSAGVNPAAYVAGLARAARRAGAQLCERTRVQNIARESNGGASGFRVTTSRGTMRARDIFVATGGYTGRATRALQKRIVPIGSYVIATEPFSEGLAAQLSPRNRMIYDTKNYLHYYRLTPDRRMLFGGRAAFLPETPQSIERSAVILRKDMVGVYPALREAAVEYAWGGTLDFTFDMLPHAGKLDGVYYAMGYAGHGVAMATYLGMKLAEGIAGGRKENPFAELEFPTAPLGLYNGSPWFLPLAGTWYKFLDWVR